MGADYPRADLMRMTPRQLAGCAYFAARRRRSEAAEDMAIAATAARADGKALQRRISELQKD